MIEFDVQTTIGCRDDVVRGRVDAGQGASVLDRRGIDLAKEAWLV